MTLQRANCEWYTLVRFDGTPTKLTGVAQTRTAVEAIALSTSWAESYPGDTTVVFDQRNAPLSTSALAEHADREQQPAFAG